MEGGFMTNFVSIGSLLITLLVYFLLELYRSFSLSQSKIIRDFADTIDPEKFSRFNPTSTNVNSMKKILLEKNLKYSGLVIRQAISFAISAKKNLNKIGININIESIDKLTGQQFEKFLSDFFKYRGYKVLMTKASGDQGVDLIIYMDERKIAVQCKRYKQSIKVGNTAVQEVVTGKLFYNCTEAWVITTSTYTLHAIQLANKVGVKLIDRKGLMSLMKGYVN